MKIIAVLLLFILTASCSAGDEMSGTAKIYYIPIGVETYIPITKENIEEHEFSYGEQNIATRDFQKLLELINVTSAGSFNNNRVRVKIILPHEKIIFIDNEGGIDSKGKQLALSDSDLQKAKELLDDMTERVTDR